MVETVMVLVVFFFILAIGFTYYQRFSDRGIDKRASDALSSRALKLGRIALSLPELQCSSDNVIEENCVDVLKIKAMEDMLAQNTDLQLIYADVFSFGRVYVEEAYPNKATYDIYKAREPPGGIQQREVLHFPINIWDPLSTTGVCLKFKGRCDFGVLVVEVYQ